jgi:hypothetical protein
MSTPDENKRWLCFHWIITFIYFFIYNLHRARVLSHGARHVVEPCSYSFPNRQMAIERIFFYFNNHNNNRTCMI